MGTLPWDITLVNSVGVPVPQGSVPKEREPIFKSIFMDVFEMIESSHPLLLSFCGNLLWIPGFRVLAFLGTGNLLGSLAPYVPKLWFLKVGTQNPQSSLRSRVPENGNPNLTPLTLSVS